MFISSCCGEKLPFDFIDYGMCPYCHEHCDIINEDDYEEEPENLHEEGSKNPSQETDNKKS